MKEQSKQIIIRFAKENELARVNELRKQVNDLHVEGKPEIFRQALMMNCKISYIRYGKIQSKKLLWQSLME